MAKNTKYIIYLTLITFLFFNKAYSIESAAHKAEVAKCFGVLMTIKNNSVIEETRLKANKILDLYIDKILGLKIGSIMMKEMSDQGANAMYKELKQANLDTINHSIQRCINTFRIG
ncbi:MAG TPA: hypothetical protein EYQ51_01105 [Alphaproteobacteria bacterium]|nr:hypothetical protein [Alphaproteobacteria bacterium]